MVSGPFPDVSLLIPLLIFVTFPALPSLPTMSPLYILLPFSVSLPLLPSIFTQPSLYRLGLPLILLGGVNTVRGWKDNKRNQTTTIRTPTTPHTLFDFPLIISDYY
jgi:hypothetical protein